MEMPETPIPVRVRVGTGPEVHVCDVICTPEQAVDPGILPRVLRLAAARLDRLSGPGGVPPALPGGSRAMAMIVTSDSDDPAATAHARGWPVPPRAVPAVEEFLFGLFGDACEEGLIPMAAIREQAARAAGVYWRPGRGPE